MLTTHTLAQGSGRSYVIPLALDGVAHPVAGWAPRVEVRPLLDPGGSPVLTYILGDGIEARDATTWRLTIEAIDTPPLAPGRYHVTVSGLDPAGTRHLLERWHLLITTPSA